MTSEEFVKIEKPSELLQLALDDLKAVEQQSKYVVDMSSWHIPQFWDSGEEKKCEVCFAGAIMATTLGTPIEISTDPAKFDPQISKRLYAVDRLRVGEIYGAFEYLDIPFDGFVFGEVKVAEYDQDDPEPFHQSMENLLEYLRFKGY